LTVARAPARPAVQALLGAACISPMPVLVALAHSAKAGLVAIVAYRCGLALPVLAVLALAEGRRSRRRPWASRAYAFVAGLLLAVDLVLFNHTIIDVGAGVSTVIGSMYVPFVAGLAWVLLKERPTGRYLVTLSVAIGGIVLASGVVGGSGTGRDPGAGILYCVVANVAYAGYLLILRQASAGTAHVVGQLFDATAGTATGALILGLTSGGLQLAVSLRALGWLLLLSMVVQVAGWILITASLPAALSSLLLLLQPALALLLGAIVLGEVPTAIQWTGVVIASGGVAAAALAKPKPADRV